MMFSFDVAPLRSEQFAGGVVLESAEPAQNATSSDSADEGLLEHRHPLESPAHVRR